MSCHCIHKVDTVGFAQSPKIPLDTSHTWDQYDEPGNLDSRQLLHHKFLSYFHQDSDNHKLERYRQVWSLEHQSRKGHIRQQTYAVWIIVISTLTRITQFTTKGSFAVTGLIDAQFSPLWVTSTL